MSRMKNSVNMKISRSTTRRAFTRTRQLAGFLLINLYVILKLFIAYAIITGSDYVSKIMKERLMAKQQLSDEQKRLDIDLWIIALTTLATFVIYMIFSKPLMEFVKNTTVPAFLRLLVSAVLQFGVAGLGVTIVCILRKEKFRQFGLVRKNLIKTIVGTAICFVPMISYFVLSGRFKGYHPLNVIVAKDILASGLPISILGMGLIAIVWGFFEGFNYAIIAEKINHRYDVKPRGLDYGALICAIACLLLHPFSDVMDMVAMFIAIYGMLKIKTVTGNAWGCVLAFMFIWNAL